MKIKITQMYSEWESGNSFQYNDIPNIDTPEKVKDHLWSSVNTNHLFKSREDLNDKNKWKVEIL